MPYIHFTEEQKERAASVNLEEFLRSRGEILIRSGREKRLASDHSVTIQRNKWFDHSAQRGGGPISFLRIFCGMDYPGAVTALLGENVHLSIVPSEEEQPAASRPFELPRANGEMRRVYAYLIRTRGIDRSVVTFFARKGLIYEDREHHNCVFVGTDENGTARHAQQRSTSTNRRAFRLNVEGGDQRYTFNHAGTDDQLYVFEAPIDMLSYISLHPVDWQKHSYVACCGTSFCPVEKMLERLPQTGQVFLCLDNDHAGHSAAERMTRALASRELRVERLLSRGKDWNDELMALMYPEQEVQPLCQELCGY